MKADQTDEPNKAQRDLWNAESQLRLWPRREKITERVTPLVLKALAPAPGERILDVGCGGGLGAIEIAKAVAPDGAHPLGQRGKDEGGHQPLGARADLRRALTRALRGARR